MQNTVLVLGATGKLGKPVARHLKNSGFQVRVMTRNADKARKLFDESFEFVEGDPLDTNTLDEALTGCFGVHMSISPPAIEPIIAEQIASIASPKGLQRVTYVSGTNNSEKNTWHYIPKVKLAAEKAIRESGVPWTIFCPTAVMENLPVYVREGRATIFGRQPHPLHWYAADDFGRMAAASYLTGEGVNKRLFIHGPEGIRTHDAVKRYCSVFHPEIQNVSTIPFWLAKIVASISRNKDMKMAILATSLYEKAGEGGDPTEANRILGAPATTLDVWLEKRKLNASEGSV